MFEPELGVSLDTVSNELNDETLQALAQSRIATLEISPMLLSGDRRGAQEAWLRDLLRRSGIRVMSVHSPYGDNYDLSSLDEKRHREAIAATLSSIHLALEFDAPIIVVHASAEPIDPQERGQRLEQARAALAEIGQRCQEVGRRVAIELLPRTCLGNTVEELFELMDKLSEETFGICLDTNHLMGRYQNLADDVRGVGDRLIALHLSDYDGVDEKHELPGTGVIDWKSVMEALRDVEYKGPFNYECRLEGETPKERIMSLEKNFDWLCGL